MTNGSLERQGLEKEVRVFASLTKFAKAICRGRVITQKCERGRCNSISQKERVAVLNVWDESGIIPWWGTGALRGRNIKIRDDESHHE